MARPERSAPASAPGRRQEHRARPLDAGAARAAARVRPSGGDERPAARGRRARRARRDPSCPGRAARDQAEALARAAGRRRGSATSSRARPDRTCAAIRRTRSFTGRRPRPSTSCTPSGTSRKVTVPARRRPCAASAIAGFLAAPRPPRVLHRAHAAHAEEVREGLVGEGRIAGRNSRRRDGAPGTPRPIGHWSRETNADVAAISARVRSPCVVTQHCRRGLALVAASRAWCRARPPTSLRRRAGCDAELAARARDGAPTDGVAQEAREQARVLRGEGGRWAGCVRGTRSMRAGRRERRTMRAHGAPHRMRRPHHRRRRGPHERSAGRRTAPAVADEDGAAGPELEVLLGRTVAAPAWSATNRAALAMARWIEDGMRPCPRRRQRHPPSRCSTRRVPLPLAPVPCRRPGASWFTGIEARGVVGVGARRCAPTWAAPPCRAAFGGVDAPILGEGDARHRRFPSDGGDLYFEVHRRQGRGLRRHGRGRGCLARSAGAGSATASSPSR